MRIDSHHHLWQYDTVEYDWIDDSMAVIAKDFDTHALTETLAANGFDGAVTVQARQSLEETRWLLSLADTTPAMLGVVGWIDLRADDLDQQLAEFLGHPKLVGFRHVIQGESDPLFMQNPAFIRGLQLLAQHNLRYDLLIFAHQLPAAIEMLKAVPELHVVIDHIAKPDIKTGADFDQWAENMQSIASLPNTHCKVSGMVTEADWHNWQQKTFAPYLSKVLEAFGPERIMFGSDWPVCLVAAEYSEVKNIINEYVSGLSSTHQALVMGGNAKRFYQIK